VGEKKFPVAPAESLFRGDLSPSERYSKALPCQLAIAEAARPQLEVVSVEAGLSCLAVSFLQLRRRLDSAANSLPPVVQASDAREVSGRAYSA
jgi:hypothetical protein